MGVLAGFSDVDSSEAVEAEDSDLCFALGFDRFGMTRGVGAAVAKADMAMEPAIIDEE